MTDTRYLRAGDCFLDRIEQTLTLGENNTQLSVKPFLVLNTLMMKDRSLVSKDDLIEAAWDGRAVSDGVVTTVIKELRQILGDNARQPIYIETVHGRGYRFLLPVKAHTAEQFQPKPVHASNRTTKSSAPSNRIAVVSMGLVIVVGVLLWVVWGSQALSDNMDASEPVAAIESASVAVLPFSDLSPSGNQSWFAEGLTEELLDSLSQSPGLLVASKRSSSLFTKNSDKVSDIAEELGIDYLIEGSIRRNGDLFRITVQLVRANDGFQAWSQSFDRPASAENVFEVQSEIATAVATRFGLTTGLGFAGANTATSSTEAYEAYRRARTLMLRRDRKSLEDSLSQFDLAIAHDSSFGPAHAGKAEAMMLATAYSGAPNHDLKVRLRPILDRATELAPDAQETLRAEALFNIGIGDFEAALSFSDRAVRANPNDSESHRRRGSILLNLSRISEAEDAFEAARLREPTSPIVLVNLTDLAIISGDMKKALDYAQQAKRWNPDDPLGDFALGSAYYALADYSEAHFAWREVLSVNPRNQLAAIRLGELYWRLGMPERARSVTSPTPWMLEASAKLYAGSREEITEIVEDNAFSVSNVLPSVVILYLARESESAISVAELHLKRWMLLDDASYKERNRSTTIAIYDVLRTADDPRADIIKSKLVRYFNGLEPQSTPQILDLYIGAATKLLEGNQLSAFDWAQEAVERGAVLRELFWDPVFDSVREQDLFIQILRETELIAQKNRNLIEAQLAANAERWGIIDAQP